MKRILVIRGGAIGDFVLTLPAIKLLRDEFPEARIEILGYKHIIALAENRFYADAVRSIEYAALASFFASDAKLPDGLAGYFGSFDLVISYLFDPDGVFERNLRRCGVETLLTCSPKVSGDTAAAMQLAAPLAQLGLPLTNPAPVLFPSAADRRFADSFTAENSRGLIAIHPGSGSALKTWPTQQWRELGSALLDAASSVALIVIGGEADRAALAELKTHWKRSRLRFAEDLPLPHLAAVIEKCALFIGHDSGISHIAAAVGVPCLLLFGPTDPNVWAPSNARVRVLQSATANMADLPVETVKDLARALVTACG